jgi:hypothetical protein
MNTLIVLYVTAALMAFVAVSCTALCFAWSIPSWRRRLARPGVAFQVREPKIGGLTDLPALVGNALVSTGIAACAVVGWYGCYCVLTALNAASW